MSKVETTEPQGRRSVFWVDGRLRMVDQRGLPTEFGYLECTKYEEVAECIKVMAVRGAPAIGAAGGFAMVLAAQESKAETVSAFVEELTAVKAVLDASRPTAVNLSWATGRLLELVKLMQEKGINLDAIKKALSQEAQELADDDVSINKRLGAFGAEVVKEGANMLHHCNTGCLATVDYGTALGIIYTCHEQGKNIHVWVDETRPRLQGARLTAWELMREGVPMHLIADSASGMLMRDGKVDVVVFGADRVAQNGDVANKIGTYNLSVVARENGVPVYAAVPTSTIDLSMKSGDEIEIEERSADEITTIRGNRVAPEDVQVFNPAFDVTPYKYLTGIVTEEGICYPPYEKTLVAAKARAEERLAASWEKRLEKYLSS